MSILVTSDLQLDDRPLNRHRHDFMLWLEKLIKERRVEWLYILGDLTEDKDRHSAWLVNAITDAIARLAETCQVVIMRGNHDYLGDPNCPFFGFLRHVPDVHWIGTPTASTRGGLSNQLFLPHSRDYERDWKELRFSEYNWIWAHNIFTGANTDTGFRLSGIPTSIFKGAGTIISGDVHTPQQVGPVEYVGSPYLCDFGDDYNPRVLHVSDRGELTSIECPGPFKRLAEASSLAQLKRMRFSRGDILKVRLHLNPADLAQWPAIQQEARSWAQEKGYIPWAVIPSHEPEGRSRATLRAPSRRQTDLEVLEAYGKARGVPPDLMKTGRWVLDRA